MALHPLIHSDLHNPTLWKHSEICDMLKKHISLRSLKPEPLLNDLLRIESWLATNGYPYSWIQLAIYVEWPQSSSLLASWLSRSTFPEAMYYVRTERGWGEVVGPGSHGLTTNIEGFSWTCWSQQTHAEITSGVYIVNISCPPLLSMNIQTPAAPLSNFLAPNSKRKIPSDRSLYTAYLIALDFTKAAFFWIFELKWKLLQGKVSKRRLQKEAWLMERSPP